MSSPLVSVIIPFYNGAKYFEETLDSVLKQTYPQIEIILINDGSTNPETDTFLKNILEKKKSPQIRLYTQMNQGLSETRNRGIEYAQGQFIALLDQDDLWRPEKIERQVKQMQAMPGIGLAYTDCLVHFQHSGKNVVYSRQVAPHQGFCFPDLLLENFIVCSSVLIKKSILDELGHFDKKYKQAEEYDLFLRIARKYSLAYLSDPLTTYRVHESNSTHGQGLLAQSECREILRGYLEDLDYSATASMAIAKTFYVDAKVQLKKRAPIQSFSLLTQLAKTHPLSLGRWLINDLSRVVTKGTHRNRCF